MKLLCKHCVNSCKRIGLISCDKYNAIADKSTQLKEKINKAYANGDYQLARKLQEELDRFWYGSSKI